jgi:chromosome partitioning protein
MPLGIKLDTIFPAIVIYGIDEGCLSLYRLIHGSSYWHGFAKGGRRQKHPLPAGGERVCPRRLDRQDCRLGRLPGNELPIPVERFGTVEQALKVGNHYDLLILDGPPHSTAGTLKIAAASLLTLLPTGLSLDDLEPSVLLAHELRKREVKAAKIAFALSRVGDSESEIEEAREYITQAGYRVLAGSLPEKTAYRRASDEGRSLTETRFPSLNKRSDELAQGIVDLITQMQKGKEV